MQNNLPENWQVFESADKVAHYMEEAILNIAQRAIERNGAFHLVTAGGTTPLQIYHLLAAFEQQTTSQKMDWDKWNIYLGDERCLPKEDRERNSFALDQAWLKHSAIPLNNRHYMSAELGAKQAAKLYESVVKGLKFDVVLLGIGEDGHTASLFPGHSHESERRLCVQTEFNSPKPPAERVTLSAECLANSRHLFKLVTGRNKQHAVKQWLAGADLPIAQIQGDKTQVLISQESLI